MQISHDYMLRRSPFFDKFPNRKDKVNDTYFKKVLGIVGSHQRCIDISRCERLNSSTFLNLNKCKSLMYLDISFTKVMDLSPLCELISLKSLNIAGVKVNDFSCLKYLDTLELLSLRSCLGITNLNDISKLLVLRSLDIGHCLRINTISPLLTLTRIEELVLDSSGIDDLHGSLNVFGALKELRILNVNNTVLSNSSPLILESLHIDASLETHSRDYLFILAAIENDFEKLRLYIGSGQDLETRAGPEFSGKFIELWQEKLEGSTPFVACMHEDELLRPTALHLAILFYSIECVEILTFAGADCYATCFFGEMKLENGILVYDKEKAQFNAQVKRIENPKYQIRVELDSQDLAERSFEYNFCRLARGYKAEKIMNWKEIAKFNYYKLRSILSGTIDVDIEFHNSGPEPSRSKAITTDVNKNKPKDYGNVNENEATKNIDDNESENENESIEDDFDDNNSQDSIAMKMKSMSKNSGGLQTFPIYKGQSHWRELAMVKKVSGKPLKIKPSRIKTDSEISIAERLQPGKSLSIILNQSEIKTTKFAEVLGKKSFWLESTIPAIREHQQKELDKFNSLKIKPSLYRTKPPPSADVIETPLVVRKERFFGYLEKEVEKRTAIKNEILDHDL